MPGRPVGHPVLRHPASTAMRSVIDFYRRNPLVLVLALVVGGALCAAVAATASGGIVGPVILVALIGILVGLGVAWYRNGERP
jgi:hypothetical protein